MKRKRGGQNIKRAIGVIAFVLVLASVFSVCDRILSRKSIGGWWNVTEKIDGFYNSPKNEYDVIFFGSSNAYCSFNPLVIWEKTGVKSYVFATQQQPVWATYHYMVDAFERQSPDVAVMDILMLSHNDEYYDDGVNYTFCDNMPFSKNKLELIWASAPKGERFNLACRFMKYHSRWNELAKEDFLYKKSEMRDYSKGFCMLTSTFSEAERQDISGIKDSAQLSEKNLLYLNKIIDLCEEKGVELLLVKTPSNATAEEKRYYNAVEAIAKKREVDFFDYNLSYEEIGLDLKTDFYDETHLNIKGAAKFSEYFVSTQDYFAGKVRNDEKWAADYEKYFDIIKE